jgi:hypothetical protein
VLVVLVGLLAVSFVLVGMGGLFEDDGPERHPRRLPDQHVVCGYEDGSDGTEQYVCRP